MDIPITGDWESAGSLYENEELIVEVDYKLSQVACDTKSEFGNSNHLYRFRITSKKPTKQIEDKFLSFNLIFQDCQGVVICKTANVNIGIRRKNDIWDGVQPLADPNGDNSFVGKKLLVPFGEVRISKQKNPAKDGECYAKVAHLMEKKKAEEKPVPSKQSEMEEVENPMITDSQFYPEVKIVKDAKMRMEADVFSSAVGTLTASKKVFIIGQQDAFWKIKFKDREGYILIADQNIDEKDTRAKLNAAIAKEQVEIKKLTEAQKQSEAESKVVVQPEPVKQVVQDAPAKPIEKPKPAPLKADEVILLRDVAFKGTLVQTKKPATILKDEVVKVTGYDSNHWQVLYQGKVGFIVDESQIFEAKQSISIFKEQYEVKLKQAVVEPEKPAAVQSTSTNSIALDREAKLRKTPEYGSASTSIAAFETIEVEGYINRHWKVNYKGEVGYLADDMMYFKETEYLLTQKANPLKPVTKQPEAIVDSNVPIYPGGEVELSKDIISKMKYAFNPRGGKIIKVTYDVTVDEKGFIDSIIAENSISLAVDEEIEKAVKLIKPFAPARKNGVPFKSKLKIVVELK